MSESEVRVASSPTLLLETRACLSLKTSGSSVRVRTRTSAFRDLGRVAYMPVSLDPSSACSSLNAYRNSLTFVSYATAPAAWLSRVKNKPRNSF